MNINRRRVLKAAVMAGIVGASASMGLQGCDTINKHVPGGTDIITSALGMDMTFEIPGAPSDEVDQVFFYAERTNQMMGSLEQMGQGLANEFARTFDIKVNTATDAGMAELAEESANIDPNTMTPEQKQWVEKNLPMIQAWGYAGVSVLASAKSFTVALPKAGKTAAGNLGKYSQKYPDPIGAANKLLDDINGAISKIEPVVDSGESVVKNAMRLGEATGVTPPTEEEERANASKLASQGLPAGEEVEFS